MNLFDRLRTQKVLSFTLILFTLSVGIVIGTLVNQGVKAAKSDGPTAPGATPLVIPNPVELSNSFSTLAKQVEPSVVNISTEYLPKATARPRGNGRRQVIRSLTKIRMAAPAWTISFIAFSATAADRRCSSGAGRR